MPPLPSVPGSRSGRRRPRRAGAPPFVCCDCIFTVGVSMSRRLRRAAATPGGAVAIVSRRRSCASPSPFAEKADHLVLSRRSATSVERVPDADLVAALTATAPGAGAVVIRSTSPTSLRTGLYPRRQPQAASSLSTITPSETATRTRGKRGATVPLRGSAARARRRSSRPSRPSAVWHADVRRPRGRARRDVRLPSAASRATRRAPPRASMTIWRLFRLIRRPHQNAISLWVILCICAATLLSR